MIADIDLLSDAVARITFALPRALSAAAGSSELLSITASYLVLIFVPNSFGLFANWI
jgi:hypothetical protein